MFFKIKNILVMSLIVVISWSGLKAYYYFFDNRAPILQLSGLQKDEYYCADIQCLIAVDKTGEITAWLDNKPLLNKFQINSAKQETPFSIPTRTISNGKHTIKLSFIDKTFKKNKALIEKEFYVDNIPLQAAFIQPETAYKVLQGRTLHLQFQVNKKIKEAKALVLSNSYPCFPESKNSSIYETFIPIPCEETPNEYLLSMEIQDQVGNTINLENKFQIVAYPFKKTTLHLDTKKIEEEKKAGKAANEFEELLEQLNAQSPHQKLWRGAFCTPIDITRTTCEFGTIRTTQQKGKYQHKAVDIINMPKSVVWAAQNGIVVMKDRFEESGNTIAIDHGYGVISMYFHLNDFANINVGQKISKGNPIGTMGKTGYAKGYHLHWEMRVDNTPIDPMQWTKRTF